MRKRRQYDGDKLLDFVWHDRAPGTNRIKARLWETNANNFASRVHIERRTDGNAERAHLFLDKTKCWKVLSFGVGGEIPSLLQGGKFGHGFVSAAAFTLAVGASWLRNRGLAPRKVINAAIAGTVSKVTGGKFANGAVTAAFAAVVEGVMSGSFAWIEWFKYYGWDDQAAHRWGEIYG